MRLDRPKNIWIIRFTDMLTSLGPEQRVDQPTHDQNGILDVDITRTDLPPQFIKVTDVGLSDHHLVQWSLELETITPVYETIFCHAWRSFNTSAFKSELHNSLLCNKSDITSPPHPDEMVKHYNDVMMSSPTSSSSWHQCSRSPAVDERQTSGLTMSVTNLSSVLGDSSGDISPHYDLVTRRFGGRLSTTFITLFLSRASSSELRR